MRWSFTVSLLSCLLLAPLAAAQTADRFVPHVGLELGQTAERLEVPGAAGTVTEDRDLFSTRLALGLDYGLLGAPVAGGAIGGRTLLGADVLLGPGRWGLVVEQAAAWRRPLGAGFAARLGLGLTARIDLERTARSQLDVTLPVGVSWSSLELAWRPAWRVPLGSDEADVFGGRRTQSIAPGLSLLAFALRVHLDALAW